MRRCQTVLLAMRLCLHDICPSLSMRPISTYHDSAVPSVQCRDRPMSRITDGHLPHTCLPYRVCCGDGGRGGNLYWRICGHIIKPVPLSQRASPSMGDIFLSTIFQIHTHPPTQHTHTHTTSKVRGQFRAVSDGSKGWVFLILNRPTHLCNCAGCTTWYPTSFY